MAAFVVDASAVVRLLGIGTQDERFARVFAPDHERHAPELVDVEVVAAIRHALLASIVDERRAADMVADHLRAPIRRYRHLTLIDRAYEWRRNVSIADGVYLALAERLGVPLVTADRRLRRAAHQLTQVPVLP
jgi:predicted nucleic acid-binding protein